MKAYTGVCLNGLALALICASAFAATPNSRSDGAELIYATSGSNSAQNPAFSPDGTTLMFTLYSRGYDGNGGPGGVWKMPAEGGTASAIYDGYGATNVNGLASWNGAVDRVTFADTQNAAKLNGDIWIVKPDGSALQRVTNAAAMPGHTYQEPTFAPDGSAVAFEDDLDVPKTQSSDRTLGAIAILSLQTGAVQRIVSDGDNRLPVWSPDGSRILFQRRTNPLKDGGYHLFTVHPDGSGLAQITGLDSSIDHCDSDASWAADGQWIVESALYRGSASCEDDSGDTEPKIYLIAADGSQVVPVTSDPKEEDGAPAMSPDGRWIYFESHRSAYDDESPAQIWRIANPLLKASDTETLCLTP
ncbi:MAG: PD40 domain-containing protein [Rudaea sp.]|uniref:PD40 domain-containing protein n=1 Tax=unclassified Rudaea TaxID=2627037 RepID=UPI0010F489B2|nr:MULTISPECIES: PD40 domain-containing protein [unclassified Rudaea]MBN8888135.1 PD40 domain-containing protein [Rudaea sp.]MBR0344430.1 PD40 domain-containing protein [Rudaea sp.]